MMHLLIEIQLIQSAPEFDGIQKTDSELIFNLNSMVNVSNRKSVSPDIGIYTFACIHLYADICMYTSVFIRLYAYLCMSTSVCIHLRQRIPLEKRILAPPDAELCQILSKTISHTCFSS